MDKEITERTEPTRFELQGNGGTGVLEFVEHGNVWHMTHTYVPDALRGQGIAARLARHALDAARARGKKVVPQCSYIDAYIARNPEYKDLVSGP